MSVNSIVDFFEKIKEPDSIAHDSFEQFVQPYNPKTSEPTLGEGAQNEEEKEIKPDSYKDLKRKYRVLKHSYKDACNMFNLKTEKNEQLKEEISFLKSKLNNLLECDSYKKSQFLDNLEDGENIFDNTQIIDQNQAIGGYVNEDKFSELLRKNNSIECISVSEFSAKKGSVSKKRRDKLQSKGSKKSKESHDNIIQIPI